MHINTHFTREAYRSNRMGEDLICRPQRAAQVFFVYHVLMSSDPFPHIVPCHCSDLLKKSMTLITSLKRVNHWLGIVFVTCNCNRTNLCLVRELDIGDGGKGRRSVDSLIRVPEKNQVGEVAAPRKRQDSFQLEWREDDR